MREAVTPTQNSLRCRVVAAAVVEVAVVAVLAAVEPPRVAVDDAVAEDFEADRAVTTAPTPTTPPAAFALALSEPATASFVPDKSEVLLRTGPGRAAMDKSRAGGCCGKSEVVDLNAVRGVEPVVAAVDSAEIDAALDIVEFGDTGNASTGIALSM